VHQFCTTIYVTTPFLSLSFLPHLMYSQAMPDLVGCVDRSGLTALHWAIYYDHPQHLKVLLKK